MTPKQIDLVQIRKMASKKEKENWRFRQFLKGSEGLDIDRRVAEITERVWAGIDCTTCANCCRELQPTFSEEDISRVARRLGMDRQQNSSTRICKRRRKANQTPGKLAQPKKKKKKKTCPFLKGNLCSIYEDRPGEKKKNCSDYPRPSGQVGFHLSVLGRPIERDSSPPIVYEVMEELKRSLRSEWQAYNRQ